MWFKNIFHRRNKKQQVAEQPLFDESFLRRLERMSLQAQHTLRGHPASGEHPSRHLLPSTIFSDHRPYASGDDLRYIDWNAYARQGHMLLKLGEAEQDIDVHLMLDVSRSMSWGHPSKLRVVQQLVGALGYLSLAHSDRVHIVPFGTDPLTPFGPAQGKGRVMDMLRYIENVSVQQETNIEAVMQHHARRYQRGGLMILCSDLLTAQGLSEGLSKFQPPRWQVLVLHVLDQREILPELSGSVELTDSETGKTLSITMDETLLNAYRHNILHWQEHMALTCARRGALYARIFTDMSLEKKVIPYLRARRMVV